MPLLRIRTPGRDVLKYEMTEDSVTVGRQRGNTIVLSADQKLSRTHCRIRKAGESFVVEDAGSANGTRLNGALVRGAQPLCSGDVVKIGGTEITFDDPLSPKRSWVSKMWHSIAGVAPKSGGQGGSTSADGTVFGDGYIKCGKCGAKIHTGNKGPGMKVGCSRCRSVYVVPSNRG
jgi:pSer/pThr/pTyr-binding forkhead associated (FHA) protein